MRFSIFNKIYFSIILVFIFIMLFFGYLIIEEQKKNILDSIKTNALSISKLIEIQNSTAMLNNDRSTILDNNIKILSYVPELLFITFSKENGEKFISRSSSWEIRKSLPPEVQALENKIVMYKIIQNPYDSKSQKVFYYVYPLSYNGIYWGWIHIGLSLDQLEAAYKLMYHKFIVLFVIFFVSISLLSYFIVKQIVSPVLSLTREVKKMEGGNFEINIQSKSNDEIGDLTTAFKLLVDSINTMRLELQTQNKFLEIKVQERTKDLIEVNNVLELRVNAETSKRMEQELVLIHQSRQAAMGEMIANIAHQWRQPLNALSLLTQHIKFTYFHNKMSDEYIEDTYKKAMNLILTMSNTIDDFRNFFTPNIEKNYFSINNEINSVHNMLSASFYENLITIEIELEDDLTVFGYSNQFSQVILNILSNAQDALIEKQKEHRLIRVNGYKKDENELMITIADNGGGIDDQILDKIFDPYFTTKPHNKGSGIGLYMSKIIIESNMEGFIHVENIENGCLFTIHFYNT